LFHKELLSFGKANGWKGRKEEKHNTKLKQKNCGKMETDCEGWQPDNAQEVGTSSKKRKRARRRERVQLSVA
jgi:hypothetical protein